MLLGSPLCYCYYHMGLSAAGVSIDRILILTLSFVQGIITIYYHVLYYSMLYSTKEILPILHLYGLIDSGNV